MSKGDQVERPWEFQWRGKEPGQPPMLGGETQLVVDDEMIEATHLLSRRVNPPQKHPEPVLTPTLPYEGDGVVSYGSVVKLPGTDRYRLYYRFLNPRAPGDDGKLHSALCFAESTDLYHWDKPLLADFPYAGQPRSNALTAFGHDCASVLLDEADPDPRKLFKLAYSPWDWPEGLRTAASADGLHWTQYEGRILKLGDRMSLYYNPVKKKYTAWSRCYAVKGLRAAFAAESDDFENWYPIPRSILEADALDAPDTGIYGATAFWYESQLLGFVEIYRAKIGKLHTQFMSSRDGHNWRREEHREAFVACGAHGSRDGYWVFPTDNAPVRIGDRLHLLLSERRVPHSPLKAACDPPSATIGLATLRVDGFASLDAGLGGWMVTKPFTFDRKGLLTVNACPLFPRAPDDPMKLTVTVRDEAGRAIPNYAEGDAVAVGGDSLRHELRWKARADLSELRGRPIRLAFHMTNTRLYSYTIR